MHSAPRVALVTGCSSGIGRAAVARLADAGLQVVATARRLDAVADLAGPRVEVAALDVTDEAQRSTVVRDVLARHGRLDVLVNNAGYGATLAMEDTPATTMRAMFETNVVAPNELARLVLPAMRRLGHGRIVNVASVAGHISVPMIGCYSSTKFALRAQTWAMDNEVRAFGIRAVLVEPGVIRTRFGDRSLQETHAAHAGPQADDPMAALAAGPYGPWYRQWFARRGRHGGADADVIARAITRAATAKHPRFHNFAPLHAKAANLVHRWTPDALQSALMRWRLREAA